MKNQTKITLIVVAILLVAALAILEQQNIILSPADDSDANAISNEFIEKITAEKTEEQTTTPPDAGTAGATGGGQSAFQIPSTCPEGVDDCLEPCPSGQRRCPQTPNQCSTTCPLEPTICCLTSETQCSDNYDNDCDGLIDDQDTDCCPDDYAPCTIKVLNGNECSYLRIPDCIECDTYRDCFDANPLTLDICISQRASVSSAVMGRCVNVIPNG